MEDVKNTREVGVAVVYVSGGLGFVCSSGYVQFPKAWILRGLQDIHGDNNGAIEDISIGFFFGHACG